MTMRIQLYTDYAIRALLYLQKHERMCTAAEIAGAIGMSYPSFLKLAKALRRKGLMDVTQGRYGGYTLKKPAKQISVYEVYLATSGKLDISPCLENRGKACINEMKEHCVIYGFFVNVQDNMIAQMSQMKISDLAHSVERDTEKDYPKNRTATGQKHQKRFETIA